MNPADTLLVFYAERAKATRGNKKGTAIGFAEAPKKHNEPNPLFISHSLGLQTPSKKVLWGVFRGLSSFLEGIWSPRDLHGLSS